jgi:hypothetical protein
MQAVKFHTPNIIQYNGSKIPMTKEWPAQYKMSSIAIMEPHETFVGRAMG